MGIMKQCQIAIDADLRAGERGSEGKVDVIPYEIRVGNLIKALESVEYSPVAADEDAVESLSPRDQGARRPTKHLNFKTPWSLQVLRDHVAEREWRSSVVPISRHEPCGPARAEHVA